MENPDDRMVVDKGNGGKRWRAMRPLAALAGLLLLLCGCAGSSTPLKQGQESVARGDWEESTRQFQEALAKKPEDTEIKMLLARSRLESSLARMRKGESLMSAGKHNEAISELQVSVAFDPSNHRALTLIQTARNRHEASRLVKQGQNLLRMEQFHQGRESIQKALTLDPENEEARQALARFKKEPEKRPALALKFKLDTPVSLKFKQTPILNVFEVLTRMTGVNFIFDSQVRDTKVTLFMTDVAVERFIDIFLKTNGLAAKVVDEKTLLVYPDTPAKAREYQDLQIRTFYLTHMEAKKTVELLTKLLKSKDIMANDKLNAVVIRGTGEMVELAAKIVEANDRAPAELLLNVELLEVSRSKEKQLGIEISESIGVGFGRGSTRGKTGQETRTVSRSITGSTIDGRSSTGETTRETITPGTTTTTTTRTGEDGRTVTVETEESDGTVTEYNKAVIGGVTSFGGAVLDAATGLALDAAQLPTLLNPTVISVYDLANLSTKELLLSLPSATINLLKQDRETRVLAKPQIRVKHGEKASILIGSRIPLRTNRRVDSSTGDVTSDYQYYDVGVKMETEPQINLHGDVRLKLSLEVSSLGENLGTTEDPQYAINTRNAQSLLTVRDGEPVILGGLISDEERKLYRSVPMIGEVPILGRLFSNENSNGSATDILMIITPVVMQAQDLPSPEVAQFWSGGETHFSTRPPFQSRAAEEAAFNAAPRPEPAAEAPSGLGADPAAMAVPPNAASSLPSPLLPTGAVPQGLDSPVIPSGPGISSPPGGGQPSPGPIQGPPASMAPAASPLGSAAGHSAPSRPAMAEPPVAAAPVSVREGWPEPASHSIQVGSFREEGEARQRALALERLGHACYVVKADVPGRGAMFRVLTGGYNGFREAARAMAALRERGLPADSCVVKRSATL